MRYFLDTEFSEAPCTIDLISIGLVAEDGREYYAQSCEFDVDRAKANPWVIEHVLTQLQDCPAGHSKLWHVQQDCIAGFCVWKTPEAIRSDLITFIGPEPPEFWGYYCAYDWVAVCWLFGAMVDLPAGWPMYCYDLRQWLNHQGMPEVTQPDDMPHHALSDARWIRDTYHIYCRRQGR